MKRIKQTVCRLMLDYCGLRPRPEGNEQNLEMRKPYAFSFDVIVLHFEGCWSGVEKEGC